MKCDVRSRLVVGNWKLNASRAQIHRWVQDFRSVVEEKQPLGLAQTRPKPTVAAETTMVICPPVVYLPVLADLIADLPLALGVQDVSCFDTGAYTGEVSARMLADNGASYVIIGHSERRALFHETHAKIAQKIAWVQQAGMMPILCIGETQEQRQQARTYEVLDEQLSFLLKWLSIEQIGQSAIAYEPVWAIGTGNAATAEQAQTVHEWIYTWFEKQQLPAEMQQDLTLLYGGSVNPDNAGRLFTMPHIHGGLVGGASLQAKDFWCIVNPQS